MASISLTQGLQAEEKSQFTFTWPYIVDGKMSPRGGNTVGAPLTLSDLPSVNWTKLKKSSDNKKQKDRLAILAMQGPYRASFDFIESVGYQNDYTLLAHTNLGELNMFMLSMMRRTSYHFSTSL